METRRIVHETIGEVAREQGRPHVAIDDDDLPLVDTGLDSLALAVIVARLEDRLAVDPFQADGVAFPTTLGEFVSLYENAPD